IGAGSETLAIGSRWDAWDGSAAGQTVVEVGREDATRPSNRRLRGAVERPWPGAPSRLRHVGRGHLFLLPWPLASQAENRANRPERVSGDREAGTDVLQEGIELGGVATDLAPKEVVGQAHVEPRQQIAQ